MRNYSDKYVCHLYSLFVCNYIFLIRIIIKISNEISHIFCHYLFYLVGFPCRVIDIAVECGVVSPSSNSWLRCWVHFSLHPTCMKNVHNWDNQMKWRCISVTSDRDNLMLVSVAYFKKCKCFHQNIPAPNITRKHHLIFASCSFMRRLLSGR